MPWLAADYLDGLLIKQLYTTLACGCCLDVMLHNSRTIFQVYRIVMGMCVQMPAPELMDKMAPPDPTIVACAFRRQRLYLFR
jgi:hypothetical protein